LFQKKEALVVGLVKLVFSKRPVTKDIDPKKIEGFSNRLIDLGDILNDGRGGFDSGSSFHLRKASSEGGDLEIGFP
jgi:hypothetical protein